MTDLLEASKAMHAAWSARSVREMAEAGSALSLAIAEAEARRAAPPEEWAKEAAGELARAWDCEHNGLDVAKIISRHAPKEAK